jgi:hypothetical protein
VTRDRRENGRRRLRGWIAGGLAVALALPFFIERTREYYTDDAAIVEPAAEVDAYIREVLWERPVSLSAEINLTDSDEYEPRVSPDGDILVFTRGRPGSDADLWYSERQAGRWASPEPLTALQSPADELGAAFSADGNWLYFYSDRPGGLGGFDIWASRRGSEGWEEAAPLDSEVNTAWNESSPDLDRDGRLYFTTDRASGADPASIPWQGTIRARLAAVDYDVHVAEPDPAQRSDARPAFLAARALDAINQRGSAEGTVTVSPLGDFLYFASNRAGGQGGFDLYRVRIARGIPGSPESLGAIVNTAADELDPSLALGGYALYFSRAVDGREDLFSATTREVYTKVESEGPYWSLAAVLEFLAGIVRAIPPDLLAFLIALLLALITMALLRQFARRPGLLVSAFILAILAHLVAMIWMRRNDVQRLLLVALEKKESFAPFEASSAGLPEERIAWAIRSASSTAGEAAPTLAVRATRVEPLARDDVAARPRTNESVDVELVESISIAPLVERLSTVERPVPAPLARRDLDLEWRPDPLDLSRAEESLDTPAIERASSPPGEAAPPEVVARLDAAPRRHRVPSESTEHRERSMDGPELLLRSEPLPASEALSRIEGKLPAVLGASELRLPELGPLASLPERADDAGTTPSAEPLSRVAVAMESGDEPVSGASPPALASERQRNSERAAPARAIAVGIEVGLAPVVSPIATDTEEADLPRPPATTRAAGDRTSEILASSLPERDEGSELEVPSLAAARLDVVPDTPSADASSSASRSAGDVAPRLASGPRRGAPRRAARGGDSAVSLVPERVGVAPASAPSASGSERESLIARVREIDASASDSTIASGTPRRDDEASRFVPEFYRLRSKDRREEVLRAGGGDERTERAVESGLVWLARHQSPDGSWSLDAYADHLADISPRDLVHPDWNGKGRHESRGGTGRARSGKTAATGLALLCFLGHGDDHVSEGPHREVVARGLQWLLAQQESDGDLRGGGNLYMHGVAAFALCESYAFTKDPELREPAQRAIDYTVRVQHPELGGWRYDPWPSGQDVDTSVFGWMLMALESGRIGGLDLPDTCLVKAWNYLDRVRFGRAKGRFRYQPGSDRSSIAMTAQGLFCQQMLGEIVLGANRRSLPGVRAAAEEGISFILSNPPIAADMEGVNFYYWYYASLAMFQEGGEPWRIWNERLSELLIREQVGAEYGSAHGSWDPRGHRASIGGRIYSTALSILCLEVYYRYARLGEGGGEPRPK